jgi:hypothetical protein
LIINNLRRLSGNPFDLFPKERFFWPSGQFGPALAAPFGHNRVMSIVSVARKIIKQSIDEEPDLQIRIEEPPARERNGDTTCNPAPADTDGKQTGDREFLL